MSDYRVRPFEDGDRQALRDICLETSSDPYLNAHPDVLYLLYLDYYLDESPDTCFVCAGENNKALGYILCAPDSRKYIADWKSRYLPKLRGISPEQAKVKRVLLFTDRLFGARYRAHMHIDLTASVRRIGVGGRLLDALFSCLRERGVGGIYLGCSAHNEAGVAFYTKHGFKRLFSTKQAIVFAQKL